MRNLARVVQHLNSLDDKGKSERAAAFLRAARRRQKRFQEATKEALNEQHTDTKPAAGDQT